jgi:formyl-CoA transferase
MIPDLGADVIRSSHRRAPPAAGCRRSMGPPLLSAASYFFNRNKRGIALDLTTDAGKAELLKLRGR